MPAKRAAQNTEPAGRHADGQIGERSPLAGAEAPSSAGLAPDSLLASRHIQARGNDVARQAAILQLQRTQGNRATRRFLQRMATANAGSPSAQRSPLAQPATAAAPAPAPISTAPPNPGPLAAAWQAAAAAADAATLPPPAPRPGVAILQRALPTEQDYRAMKEQGTRSDRSHGHLSTSDYGKLVKKYDKLVADGKWEKAKGVLDKILKAFGELYAATKYWKDDATRDRVFTPLKARVDAEVERVNAQLSRGREAKGNPKAEPASVGKGKAPLEPLNPPAPAAYDPPPKTREDKLRRLQKAFDLAHLYHGTDDPEKVKREGLDPTKGGKNAESQGIKIEKSQNKVFLGTSYRTSYMYAGGGAMIRVFLPPQQVPKSRKPYAVDENREAIPFEQEPRARDRLYFDPENGGAVTTQVPIPPTQILFGTSSELTRPDKELLPQDQARNRRIKEIILEHYNKPYVPDAKNLDPMSKPIYQLKPLPPADYLKLEEFDALLNEAITQGIIPERFGYLSRIEAPITAPSQPDHLASGDYNAMLKDPLAETPHPGAWER